MRYSILSFVLVLSAVSFSVPGFGDSSDNYGQNLVAKYKQATTQLQNKMAPYGNDPDRFYGDPEQNMDEQEAKLETAYQMGQISEVDYQRAKKQNKK